MFPENIASDELNCISRAHLKYVFNILKISLKRHSVENVQYNVYHSRQDSITMVLMLG